MLPRSTPSSASRRLRCLGVLGSLLLAGCSLRPAPEPVSVTIRGQVMNRASGQPVPECTVDLFEMRPSPGPFARMGTLYRLTQAVTDHQGRFEIEAEGRYSLALGPQVCDLTGPSYTIFREQYVASPILDVVLDFSCGLDVPPEDR